ncbi:hypothetical protein [Clostridium sp. HBUAS56010]|uniref:hypothetical protein n=1 Tax=Clostridium sp. HBUAS56010 TaxID=2571127 RepID=UPI0011787927|nr:hypothetical protein [Clostridium sp. HBUAS56010]
MNPLNLVIRISGEWSFLVIHKLSIHRSTNQHGRLEIRGIIDSQVEVEEKCFYGTAIELVMLLEKKEKLIFKGVVQEIEVFHNGKYKEMELLALTGTCLLDEEKKSRSFQEVGMTYGEVIKTLIKDIPDSAVICTEGKERIGRPLIQYEETDWEFIGRLASLAETAVIPEVKSGLPKFWFGMRKGALPLELPDFTGKAVIHNQYKKTGCNQKHNISYVFLGEPGMEIGDKVIIEGCEWIIYQIDGELSAGEFLFKYWVGKGKPGIQEKIHKDVRSGMSLKGRVEKTEKEKVTIKLEIDGKGGQGAYGYEYRPITGQVLYGMPEKGTEVSLQYLTADERGAVISDNAGCHSDSITTKDSSHKRFETDCNKNLFLFPSAMGLSSADQNGRMSKVTMADRDGMLIDSSRNITIAADGPVTIKAANIQVHAPCSIDIIQTGT